MIEHIINQTLQKNFHNKAGWNNALRRFKDKNIFQSYEWGELKKLSGWTPIRIQILDNNQAKLVAQILVKNIQKLFNFNYESNNNCYACYISCATCDGLEKLINIYINFKIN